MFTRKDYMDNKVSHSDYYGEIAKECGVTFDAVHQQEFIESVRQALKTDPNLNNIPLHKWDAMALGLYGYNGKRIREVLKERGDGWSLSTGICLLKEAASRAATS